MYYNKYLYLGSFSFDFFGFLEVFILTTMQMKVITYQTKSSIELNISFSKEQHIIVGFSCFTITKKLLKIVSKKLSTDKFTFHQLGIVA